VLRSSARVETTSDSPSEAEQLRNQGELSPGFELLDPVRQLGADLGFLPERSEETLAKCELRPSVSAYGVRPKAESASRIAAEL
jgi:hypothetical protein